MTRGTVREWHGDWGIIDSPDTPEGCWAPATEILDMDGTPELLPGESVDFDYEHLADRTPHGLAYLARNVRPVDPEWDLDDEDRELMELEEPVIEDGSPVTTADFYRDASM